MVTAQWGAIYSVIVFPLWPSIGTVQAERPALSTGFSSSGLLIIHWICWKASRLSSVWHVCAFYSRSPSSSLHQRLLISGFFTVLLLLLLFFLPTKAGSLWPINPRSFEPSAPFAVAVTSLMTGGFVVELSAVLNTSVGWTASVNGQGALKRGWQAERERERRGWGRRCHHGGHKSNYNAQRVSNSLAESSLSLSLDLSLR